MKPYTQIRLGAALVLGCALTGAPLSSGAEQQSKGWGTQFIESMKKWEDKMSEVFRSAAGGKAGDKSAYSASIDVREQSDHYTVRVHLPDRDLSKVKVTMDGRTLKIAGDGGYEQSIVLRNAATVTLPHVDRLGQTLVITVPRGDDPTAGASKGAPGSSLLAPNEAERDVLARMDNMRREMDRVFQEAFKDFDLRLDTKGYFDQPQFGSSIDLQDEKDRYVIRAYLPGRDVQKIDVKVVDQVLTVEAKAEQREKRGTGSIETFTMSGYAQSLTLPGPVQSDKMEVERKEGLLVITLPKKKS